MKQVAIETSKPIEIFSFSMDKHGDLYAANNINSFFRYRPTLGPQTPKSTP